MWGRRVGGRVTVGAESQRPWAEVLGSAAEAPRGLGCSGDPTEEVGRELGRPLSRPFTGALLI